MVALFLDDNKTNDDCDGKENGKQTTTLLVACVASVSVLFRSKERPMNEIFGFGRARNETRANFSRGLCCAVFDSRNSTETLATQATLLVHHAILYISLPSLYH